MTPPTSTTSLANVPQTVPNPVKPVAVTVIGIVIGILSMAQAYFGSGHIPTADEVAGLLGGAGLSAVSVLGFLAHHLGINRAMLMRDAAIVASSTPIHALNLPALAATVAPVATPAPPQTAS